MGIIVKPFTFIAGASKSGEAAQVNSDYDTIYTEFNGNIENANIKSNAAIAYSKLALTGGIVNADINASAAIAWSKISKVGSLVSDIETLDVGVFGWGSINLVGGNNSGTPNTQFDLDADVVILRNSDNRSVVRYNPGAAITNNVSTAGPAANGRDQAGAFSAGSWVHFYWIWNPTTVTLATLSSATAPPTGPTLPSGYTYWSYAGAVRFNGSSQLVSTRFRGNQAEFATPSAVVSISSAVGETLVGISAVVPPNVLEARYGAEVTSSGASGSDDVSFDFRIVTGVNFLPAVRARAQNGVIEYNSLVWVAPVISQQFYYVFTSPDPSATPFLTVWINGYKMPNNGG